MKTCAIAPLKFNPELLLATIPGSEQQSEGRRITSSCRPSDPYRNRLGQESPMRHRKRTKGRSLQ